MDWNMVEFQWKQPPWQTRDVFMDLLNVYDVDFCGKSSRLLTVKDTLKTFDDFKNKEKSAWINVIWNTFRKFIQYSHIVSCPPFTVPQPQSSFLLGAKQISQKLLLGGMAIFAFIGGNATFFGKHLPGRGGGPAIFAQHFCFYNTVIFCWVVPDHNEISWFQKAT